jgi:histidine kinase
MMIAQKKNQLDDENVETNTIDILNRCILSHCTNTLYGRDNEVQILNTSYDRLRQQQQQQQQNNNIESISNTTSEFILIHGASGIGKSKLVDFSFLTTNPSTKDDDVFCISGIFDQRVHFHKPNAAYIDLLTSYVDQIKERKKIDSFRCILRQSPITSDEIEVLVEMVPALSTLFDCKESATDEAHPHTQEDGTTSFISCSRSNDVVNRFKSAMIKFLRIVATNTYPIVVVLEDIHRADESALNFLLSIISDTKSNLLLFVGTTRNDINIDGLEIMLKKLSCHATTVTHLYLDNLDETSTVTMISDVLEFNKSSEHKTICDYILKQSMCNPYCIITSLQRLVELGVLWYDNNVNPPWKCNIYELLLLGDETIHDIITNKFAHLPLDVLEALKCAAFFGNKIDIEIVCHLMHKSQEDVHSYLQMASVSRYLQIDNSGDFSFSHDFIRDALIQSIPGKEEFRYRSGRRLWQCYDLEGLDENIIVVVDQLLAGEQYIVVERERLAIAKLCFRAGERSAHISSFQSAFTYMTRGISLLGTNGWRDEYKLSLDLHNAAAELAYCTGKTEKSLELTNIIAVEAHTFDDAIVGHTMKVRALGSMNNTAECIKFSLSVLEQLGESFPSKPSLVRCYIGLQRIRKVVKKKTTESLLRLPMMTDERKIAAVTILNQLFMNCIQLRPTLAPLLVFRVISLTLDYGISATSCVGFVTLGAILTG